MTRFRALVLLAVATVGFAYGVTCPIHTYASCYNTGEYNLGARKYRCTCGDEVWVRAK